MSVYGSQINDRSTRHTLCRGIEFAIVSALVGLLAFAPFAFGAVEAWSTQVVVAAAVVLAAAMGVVILLRGGRQCVATGCYVPLVLFVGLVVLQLTPLPAEMLDSVSPGASRLRSTLLADLLPLPGSQRASLYASATRGNLRLLLAVSAVFVVATNVLNRRSRVVAMLIAISVIGAGVALLAFAQDVSGATGIYWTVPALRGHAVAGPFVLHSHFSQFVNGSMGSVIALLLLATRDAEDGYDESDRLWRRAVPWLVGTLVLGATTIVFSLSRGGTLAMLAAGVITAGVIGRRRGISQSGWVLFAVGLAVFAGVLYLGLDVVAARLSTLSDPATRFSDRLGIVKDILVAWRQFPLLGAGLGTHQWVYPMFDRSNITGIATHAEDEFAQMLEETGAVGLALVAGFVAVMIRTYLSGIRTGQTPSGGIVGNDSAEPPRPGRPPAGRDRAGFLAFGGHDPTAFPISANTYRPTRC